MVTTLLVTVLSVGASWAALPQDMLPRSATSLPAVARLPQDMLPRSATSLPAVARLPQDMLPRLPQAKSCPCSGQCCCGCNEGTTCTCGAPRAVGSSAPAVVYPTTRVYPAYQAYQAYQAVPYQSYRAPVQYAPAPAPIQYAAPPVRQYQSYQPSYAPAAQATRGGGC